MRHGCFWQQPVGCACAGQGGVFLWLPSCFCFFIGPWRARYNVILCQVSVSQVSQLKQSWGGMFAWGL